MTVEELGCCNWFRSYNCTRQPRGWDSASCADWGRRYCRRNWECSWQVRSCHLHFHLTMSHCHRKSYELPGSFQHSPSPRVWGYSRWIGIQNISAIQKLSFAPGSCGFWPMSMFLKLVESFDMTRIADGSQSQRRRIAFGRPDCPSYWIFLSNSRSFWCQTNVKMMDNIVLCVTIKRKSFVWQIYSCTRQHNRKTGI